MECPFELPVKKQSYTDVLECIWYNIVDAGGITVISQLTESQADYIVQIINGHKKFKEALEEAGRDFYYIHRHSEDAHEDSYKFMSKVEQSLEAEKKE